ncbi:g7660 [Coccomyxa elongata]
MAALGDQEPAIGCVAENKMDSTDTAQPADMAAPDVENHFEDKHALHSTQAGGNKSSSAGEGILTISANGMHMVARSNELDYVGTASQGAEALVQGHGQEREGTDAIDKAVEDAIAQVQQAVAEDGS